MEEVIRDFLEHLKLRLRPATLEEYRQNLNEYVRYCRNNHSTNFDWVDSEIVQEYFAALQVQPFAPKTIWKKLHAVYALYEWLRANGVLLLNPCIKPELNEVKKLNHDIPSWQSIKPLYAMLENSDKPVDQRNYVMIDLAYSCGLRRGELNALDISDINSDEGTLLIKGKGGKERIVPIGTKALKSLLTYIYHIRPQFIKQSTTQALFLSSQGEGLRLEEHAINAVFKRLRKKYGLPRNFYPHNLRHAFATDLIRSGAPVYDVSLMLGHKMLETTQVYTHVVANDLKNHHRQFHPRG